MATKIFESTPNKILIRRTWNYDLLEFITSQIQTKLVYFGLPSPSAEDLTDWIDFIDQVIAFQCRDYPNPSDPNQDDFCVKELEKKLNAFYRKNKISRFDLYDGYIEEVILNKKDNLNIPYVTDTFITLFNLDFCNEITFPQIIRSQDGTSETKVYKLHVIRTLIQQQRLNNCPPERFITYLTIKGNFFGEEVEKFCADMTTNTNYSTYLSSISHLKGFEKKVRVLRAYIYYAIGTFFHSENFITFFLPVVRYRSGIHDLVQFCILGINENTLGCASIDRQNVQDFLNLGFIEPNEVSSCLVPSPKNLRTEITPELNPVNALIKSDFYENFWK